MIAAFIDFERIGDGLLEHLRAVGRVRRALHWRAIPVPRPWWERPASAAPGRPAIGWVRLISRFRRHDEWVPWWCAPRVLWWTYVAAPFCELAVRIGLARAPEEGCYLHELVWFPDAPRWD